MFGVSQQEGETEGTNRAETTTERKPLESFAYLEHFNNLLASISPTNDYDDGGLGEPEKTSRRPNTTPSTTARSYKDDNIQPQKPTKKYKDTLGIIDRFNNKVVMYFIFDVNQLNINIG